jgi:Protein of unknown function (DUF2865)
MRSSFVKCSSLLLLAGLTIVFVPVAANAQGFFEQLFGIQPKPKPMPSLTLPPAQYGYGGPTTPGGRAFPARDRDGDLRRSNDGEDGQPGERGTYRTLCVRMCDGYYFPISNSTTKSNFYRDQSKCKSTCGGEARLFVAPTTMTVSPTAAMENMVDLNGAAYTKLPVAFKYRKSLVAGCQCKPAPWSDAELDRHRRYAEAETTKKLPINVATKAEPTETDPKIGREQLAAAKTKGKPTRVTVASAEASETTPTLKGTLSDTPAAPVAVADLATADAGDQPKAIVPATRDKATKRQSKAAAASTPISAPISAQVTYKGQQTRPTVNTAWTPPPATSVSSGGLFGGSMGLGAGGGGGGKYAWPGDTQRR